MPILVHQAAQRGTAINVAAAAVYSTTMLLLYLVSALYHAVPVSRYKAWLNRMDHAAIYLFIAGSYTPFALGVLHEGWGWTMFCVVWSAAAVGVTVKLLDRLRHPLWSTGLYVAMGWVALLAAGPMLARMSPAGIAWLVAGGLSYTLGAFVFMIDNRVRYAHFVWHLFVIAGSACHFIAALRYAQ
jgi:hemolysin III